MKKILLPYLIVHSFCCYAQTFVSGSVKDFKTKTPVPYCSVVVKGTGKGCITNEEGVFRISVNAEKDSLVFSYIGYKTQILPAASRVQIAEVFLINSIIRLKEVVIHGDDDYLYLIMEKCRNKINEAPSHVTKVYFELESEIQKQPVEILECYYNGYINGSTIDKLLLKNGRTGLAEYDHGFFLSLNTSKAICYLNLIKGNDYLPSIPLQYNKSKLKKLYFLNRLTEHDEDNMYHIEFTPRKNTGEYFHGEVWIDQETFSIMKINLACEKVSVHPFLPLKQGDFLGNVSIQITQTYNKSGNHSLLNHINYKYQAEYKDSDMQVRLHPSVPAKEIHTSCVMYFYDYEKPFLLPYFQYDIDQSDYRKISSFPYNESFWNSTDGLIFTERQKQHLEFFHKNGLLFNFNKKNSPKGNRHIFEDNNVIWSDTARLSLKRNHLDSLLRKDLLTKKAKDQTIFLSDLYHLKAQIFLDVNREGDSIQHYSATVFDVFESYYNLPAESYTDCFINMYFDICEIERRNMEKALSSHSYSVEQTDSVYQHTTRIIDSQTKLYFKNVQSGKNAEELYKWNKYIFDNLNIDNVSVSGLKDK